MCGGRGTRLDADCEKPLYEVGGRPMADRVTDALDASRVESVTAVTSPHARDTAAHVDCPVVDAPGDGYVEDLQYALERVDAPVLTVAADLPLLAGETVDSVLDAFEAASLTVCVPAALKRRLGASVDTTFEEDGRELAPTGVNVVADGDASETHLTYDARVAVNVNRSADAALAEAFL